MRLQEVDPELRDRMKGLTFSLILVGTNAPGNEDRQLTIHMKDGKFTSVIADASPAPSDLRSPSFDKDVFHAKVIGEHQTLFDLVSGKLNPIEVISKVNIEGDFGNYISQIAGFTRLLEYLSKMGLEP